MATVTVREMPYREGDCTFEEFSPVDSVIESRVLPELRFDVRWLWSTDRPAAYQVLRDLLGDARFEKSVAFRSA